MSDLPTEYQEMIAEGLITEQEAVDRYDRSLILNNIALTLIAPYEEMSLEDLRQAGKFFSLVTAEVIDESDPRHAEIIAKLESDGS